MVLSKVTTRQHDDGPRDTGLSLPQSDQVAQTGIPCPGPYLLQDTFLYSKRSWWPSLQGFGRSQTQPPPPPRPIPEGRALEAALGPAVHGLLTTNPPTARGKAA